VYPSQITEWKQRLMEHAADVFGDGKAKTAAEPPVNVKARRSAN
jgi:hypothetical protein